MTNPEMAPLPLPADIPLGELAARSGIRITEVTRDRMVATMPVAGNRQPVGLLHGGASAVLAETLGSVHAFLLAGGRNATVGVELSCTHHRSARDGDVTAVSTPLHTGRTMTTLHIAISDATGRAVCTARLTCMTTQIPMSAEHVIPDAKTTTR